MKGDTRSLENGSYAQCFLRGLGLCAVSVAGNVAGHAWSAHFLVVILTIAAKV